MASDRSTITTAEVDAMLTATSSSRLLNGKNKVINLGNVNTPTINMLRSQGGAKSTPVRGAYKCHLASPRGKKLQGTSGRDIHRFDSVDTLFDIEFSVGRVHLGDEWVHQQLSEAGVEIDRVTQEAPIDVTKGGWWTKGSDSFEVLVNLAQQKLDALDLNYTQELNKDFWRSNTSDAKKWSGVDSALPSTSNTSGSIGNRSRTNKLLRHQLATATAHLDLESVLNNQRRACNKRTQDGTKANMMVCGETVYQVIVERMFSGSTAITSPRITRNIDNARADAQAMSQKLGIGFPDDAIYMAGVGLIMIEPVFEDLDAEDAPTPVWQKRWYMINTDHLAFKATKNRDGHKRVHATPYNQDVTRISAYGEYALVLDKIDCHGCGYIA
jgi:hypothetical protein